MVPTYYVIKFNVLDDYECETYDHEAEYDSYEEAKGDYDKIIEEFEKYGDVGYYSMELMQCGNGEEAFTLETYWFDADEE